MPIATNPHSTHPLVLDGIPRTGFLSSCLGRRTSECGLLPHSSHSRRTSQGMDLCICYPHKPYPLDSPCSARTLDDTLRKDPLGIPGDMCTHHLHTQRSGRTGTGSTGPFLDGLQIQNTIRTFQDDTREELANCCKCQLTFSRRRCVTVCERVARVPVWTRTSGSVIDNAALRSSAARPGTWVSAFLLYTGFVAWTL